MRWAEKASHTSDLYGMYLDHLAEETRIMYKLPEGVGIGNYFVSHGGGMAARVIRSVTGDWAAHAGVYVGEFCIAGDLPNKPSHVIVEATWPKVRFSRASRHPGARW